MDHHLESFTDFSLTFDARELFPRHFFLASNFEIDMKTKIDIP